jgi:hypothetical protein
MKVRTTFQPDVEVELADQAERDYLANAGLLVNDAKPTEASNPKEELNVNEDAQRAESGAEGTPASQEEGK